MSWQFWPMRKKIGFILSLLLIIALGVFLVRQKYKADSENYTFSGKIINESGQPLSGVELAFDSPSLPALDLEDNSPTYQATTGSDGKFSLSVPLANFKNGTLAFAKEGYFDEVGSFNFSALSSGNSISVNLTMKPGFGKENFVTYEVKKGFNSISFPFYPKDPANLSSTFSNLLSNSKVKLYAQNSSGTLDQYKSSIDKSYQAIAESSTHTLALKPDGTVWAWGQNSAGQLGNSTHTESSTPVQVSNLSAVVAVSCGDGYSIALKSNGSTWSWGTNSYGQLGISNTAEVSLPTEIAGLSNIKAISAGSNHVLALKSDGTLYSWGANGSGQLGDGTTTNSKIPKKISTLANIKAISAGLNYSLALSNDGTVFSWGANNAGQLGKQGDVPYVTHYIPEKIANLSNIKAISAGTFHSLFLNSEGNVLSSGWNHYGELGLGTTTESDSPVLAPNLKNIKEISAGTKHSLAMTESGELYAWGDNSSGQLGDGTNAASSNPKKINNLVNLIDISSGEKGSTVLKADGTLFSIGEGKTSPTVIDGISAGFSGEFIVKPAIGYYLQNDTSDSIFFSSQGQALNSDFAISLFKTDITTPFGSPYLGAISTDSLKIVNPGKPSETISIKDAIAQNLIDSKIYQRTSLSEIGEKGDLSADSVSLETANSYILKAKKEGVQAKFRNSQGGDSVEISPNVSLEDAEWTFWVDKSTLNEETWAIWDGVNEAMIPSALEPSDVPNNAPKGTDGPIPTYTKNGKIIPSSIEQAGSGTGLQSVPPTPSAKYKSPVKRRDENCIWFDEAKGRFKVCAVDSISIWPGNTEYIWSKAAKNNLKDYVQKIYPIIKEIYGPPMFLDSQNRFREVDVYLNNRLCSKKYKDRGACYTDRNDSINVNWPLFTSNQKFADLAFTFQDLGNTYAI